MQRNISKLDSPKTCMMKRMQLGFHQMLGNLSQCHKDHTKSRLKVNCSEPRKFTRNSRYTCRKLSAFHSVQHVNVSDHHSLPMLVRKAPCGKKPLLRCCKTLSSRKPPERLLQLTCDKSVEVFSDSLIVIRIESVYVGAQSSSRRVFKTS